MKKLSTYLFLVLFSFSTPSFGDDISKFQIEGMSIGDSLLDYFSKKQIINNKVDYSYKNNDFYAVKFDNLISSETYDGGEVYLKTNDENYIIYPEIIMFCGYLASGSPGTEMYGNYGDPYIRFLSPAYMGMCWGLD